MFEPLPPGPFDVIVADCPWRFTTYSDKGHGKSPQKHYDCLSLADIHSLPVASIAAADSYLFLWATAPLLSEALNVMRIWGFTYKTHLAWAKVTANGKPRMGCGFIARTLHELCLVGTRGKPGKGAIALPSLFNGIARESGRKPDEFYRLVERFKPTARRVDLFARQSRAGWVSYGDEATKFDPPHCQETGATALFPEPERAGMPAPLQYEPEGTRAEVALCPAV
jgi:N6-adenosine-specific RNA methylase IME4